MLAVDAALPEPRRAGPGHRPAAARRELPSGSALPARRRDHATTAARPSRSQHRRRGPAGARRRARLRRCATLDPDVLVDIATLTGAATHRAGPPARARCSPPTTRLAGGSERGRRRQRRAGLADAAGRGLPRGARLRRRRPAPTSPATGAGVGGGSIIAALFLREFAGRRPWAHLDIAGTGRAERRRRGEQGRHGLRRPPAAPLAGERPAPLSRTTSRRDDPSATNAEQQAVADREQRRHEVLVAHGRPCRPRGWPPCRGRAARGRPPGRCQRALSNATTPPGRSSRSGLDQVVAVLLLVAVDKTRS